MRMVRFSAMTLVLALGLCGCSMTTPSQVRTGEIMLKDSAQVETRTLDQFTRADAALLASDYKRNAHGNLSAVVSYDRSDVRALKDAKGQVARIARDLAAQGVSKLQAEYVAVDDPRLYNQVVFSYAALVATPPDHCTRMPGYQGGEDLVAMHDYQISCESKSMLSQMIARPEDLLGRDGKTDTTARREGAVVETYQDGKPNELFNGTAAASSVGQ